MLFRSSQVRSYWASLDDYNNRTLSVDYRLANAGPDAYGLAVAGTINSNGVVGLSATAIADIPAVGSAPFTITYRVATGTSGFKTRIYVTGSDACGAEYAWPGPYPGA